MKAITLASPGNTRKREDWLFRWITALYPNSRNQTEGQDIQGIIEHLTPMGDHHFELACAGETEIDEREWAVLELVEVIRLLIGPSGTLPLDLPAALLLQKTKERTNYDTDHRA